MRPTFNLDVISDWYTRYRADLVRARDEARAFYRANAWDHLRQSRMRRLGLRVVERLGLLPQLTPGMKTQLDDVCTELVYLALRHFQPETVVEISPCDGWSTAWILRALRDNDRGRLFSYDLGGHALQFVPEALRQGRWTFIGGDIKRHLDLVPQQIDYLFMDSDHSAAFGEWYLANLFPRLRPGTPVSVDDVYHFADPGQFDGEGEVVVRWLEQRGVPFFTAAPAKAPEVFQQMLRIRAEAGISDRIHHSERNTTIFFQMP